MIILNGKYNIARVMLPKDVYIREDDITQQPRLKYLDDATKEQIESFLDHPVFKENIPIIMPDTHFGKGSCVGFTMKLGNYVIPNIIGVDIGCGIMTTNLGRIHIDENVLKGLDEFIRNSIPSGFSIHNNDYADVPNEFREEISVVIANLGLDFSKVIRSIGSLGGGNHFIELGKDDDENVWLTIHSGSRNFGLKVATHYQNMANSLCADYFQDFGDLNFIPATDYGYTSYIEVMKVAQRFAFYNRRMMTNIVLNGFFDKMKGDYTIDSVHNYIDFEDDVIRKGATPAHKGQKVVIPFNMVDGLIIATGKGNKDWNYSAPHGAGRILSRKKAKKELDINTARQEMESAGVFTTSLNEETLDEAKGAYKDKELILEMIRDTVDIDRFVRPIYNFKAK